MKRNPAVGRERFPYGGHADPVQRSLAIVVVLSSSLLPACECSSSTDTRSGANSQLGESVAPGGTALGDPALSGTASGERAAKSSAPTAAVEEATRSGAADAGGARTRGETSQLALSCPEGMALIEGGQFWVGSPGTLGPPDEHPRFLTRVGAFCMDRTEVSTAAYSACVDSGECEGVKRPRVTCNYQREGFEQHPMNCVTWEQASRYCEQRGARLPTEVEWEYAARGGAEHRAYSWGSEPPSVERTCWKRPRSCPVGQFPEGAFGLLDMIGNVWEWTDSYYGAYPWPQQDGPHRVYRGGSWSRRFDKWMSPTLRNRWGESSYGSHLGFRCTQRPPGAVCPYGETESGRCQRGVEQVECPHRTEWNGARCVKAGQPQCAAGTRFEAGYGCVGPRVTKTSRGGHQDDGTAGVTTTRSPRFDGDCRAFQSDRPKAYRLEGGSHLGRNKVGQARGCKNRDVGVGWNSACCP